MPQTPRAVIPGLAGDHRVRAIVRALADGPVSPTDLQRMTGIPRETLYARLHELTDIRMLTASRSRCFPFGVRYELTRNGRVAYAKALLASREQRRVLTAGTVTDGDGIHDLLHLLAPALRLDPPRNGRCRLLEHTTSSQTVEVWIQARDATVSVIAKPPRGKPNATIQGTQAAWESALARAEQGALTIAGDQVLGRGVLAALSQTLSP